MANLSEVVSASTPSIHISAIFLGDPGRPRDAVVQSQVLGIGGGYGRRCRFFLDRIIDSIQPDLPVTLRVYDSWAPGIMQSTMFPIFISPIFTGSLDDCWPPVAMTSPVVIKVELVGTAGMRKSVRSGWHIDICHSWGSVSMKRLVIHF